MKRALIAFALLLSALPMAAGAACQSVREQDPETGVIIQKTRVTPKAASFVPLLIWTSDDPDSVMLAVMGNGDAPKYAKCRRLTLQADGQPVILDGTPKYDGTTSGAVVVEYLTSDIAWAEAEKLASASAITYKVCDDVFTANEEFVCQAREVVREARAWRKEQAAGKK
jgi:hypothetical protein